jgi:long-chain acyl-CoA synthetase
MQVDGAATLLEIFEASVVKHPDRPCLGWRLISGDGSAGPYKFLTYAQTRQKARELASALAQVGVQRGSKIGVYGANSVNWMLAIRAADVLSSAIVPIYDSLGESAVEYIIKHSEMSVALIEPSKLAHFASIAPRVSSGVKTVVTMADVSDKVPLEAIRSEGIKVYSWDEFLSLGASKEVKVIPPKAEDLACIMYTRRVEVKCGKVCQIVLWGTTRFAQLSPLNCFVQWNDGNTKGGPHIASQPGVCGCRCAHHHHKTG